MQINFDSLSASSHLSDGVLDRSVSAALGRLTGRQHGLVTLAQLRDLGVGRSAVRARLVSGQWASMGPSVLRVNGSPATWESELMAHILGAGNVAMASHRAAAALWGLAGFDGSTPEITIPRSRNLTRRGEIIVHRSGDLALVKPVVRAGIPTTPIGRTLLDLGAVLGPAYVQEAIADARQKGLVDWDELLDTLVAHSRRGRDGVGLLRDIVDKHFNAVSQIEGAVERLVLLLLRNANLPSPLLGHEIRAEGEVHRLGLSYPSHKVVIELEAEGGRRPSASVRSAAFGRTNALALAGWRVLRFSQRDYLNRPTRIVRYVRSALASSSPG